jgi:MFS-type transporter involved in bile tolerance (Atg22 family)
MKNIRSLPDICLVVYCLIFVVAFYGFALFEWWRRKLGRASEMYIYIELLFIAISINYMFNIIARWIFILDPLNIVDEPYEFFISNIWWQLRTIPNLIILSLIVYRMTKRACKSMRENKELERRKLKRREEDKKLNHVNGQNR